ncbi:hypothetical protein EON65_52125 [archaeon]|nr:MAG: hypothetical protein EON65_52125 [archaeon]
MITRQYTLFAKLLVIATFVSFYLMRHKIEHDGIWSTLFSANAWLDTLMDAVDQSLPSLQNQSVGGVSALRGVVKRSSIVQSRLSKVVPANESNPSLPAEQPASPEQRQQSIPEEGSSKSSHESAWGGGAFANRVLRSLFPHITITIPSGLWAWSFILWMLASFCTIFIVLLEYFLFYDCTSAQTIVNAAFTDYKPDIYSEVFNTNNRHVCSSRIYGSSADIQDKAPYDCVLPGLTCSDYDTAYARGTCSSHHCNDTLPCISHVFEGKLDMDSPYTCSLSSCLINVEYASCHASYEAVMIAL